MAICLKKNMRDWKQVVLMKVMGQITLILWYNNNNALLIPQYIIIYLVFNAY